MNNMITILPKSLYSSQTHQPREDGLAKEHKKELQKQQRLFQQLEEKLAMVNKEKAKLEDALANPATYGEKNKFLETEASYKKISAESADLIIQYEQLFDKIMKMEQQS